MGEVQVFVARNTVFKTQVLQGIRVGSREQSRDQATVARTSSGVEGRTPPIHHMSERPPPKKELTGFTNIQKTLQTIMVPCFGLAPLPNACHSFTFGDFGASLFFALEENRTCRCGLLVEHALEREPRWAVQVPSQVGARHKSPAERRISSFAFFLRCAAEDEFGKIQSKWVRELHFQVM